MGDDRTVWHGPGRFLMVSSFSLVSFLAGAGHTTTQTQNTQFTAHPNSTYRYTLSISTTLPTDHAG